MTDPGRIDYSIVIPIFNEEAVLPLLIRRIDRLLDELDGSSEAIFVDDGSSDTSGIFLTGKARGDGRYRYIGLSRNFGHQVAITAGMEAARGRAVIIMDADLQDPPEVIHEMVARWREGYQVVAARRRSRDGDNAFKRGTAGLFYRALTFLASVDIPAEVGDFRLIDRQVLDAFLAMPERDRFVRGMFAWLGFRQTVIEFDRPPRAAGTTKYSLWRMVRLALAGVVGFSDAPLRLAIWCGLAISGLALLYGLFVIVSWLAGSHFVTGWSSTIVVVTLLSGTNMLMTGILGLYIGRIHAEVKRRPLYVIAAHIGFESEQTESGSAPKSAITGPAA